MKRYNKLYEKIISKENLREALKKSCRSNGRMTVAKHKAIVKAKDNPEECVNEIYSILTSGDYKTNNYGIYPLFDPKLRLIYSLPVVCFASCETRNNDQPNGFIELSVSAAPRLPLFELTLADALLQFAEREPQYELLFQFALPWS